MIHFDAVNIGKSISFCYSCILIDDAVPFVYPELLYVDEAHLALDQMTNLVW
jgi:hypothetical protein